MKINFKILSLSALVLLCFAFVSCRHEVEERQTDLIVEGWIENGKYPVVMLHRAYDLMQESLPTDTTLEDIIRNQLVIFGRVALSDGEKEVVLTGKINRHYMPPYIYTTAGMMGEVDKEYSIKVEYKDYEATARTRIESPIELDSISVKPLTHDRVDVRAYLHLDPTEEQYYAFFIREQGDLQPFFCPLSTFTNKKADEQGRVEVQIYNPIDTTYNQINIKFDKVDNQLYRLKLARLTAADYQYWEAYNAQSATQGMFFMSTYRNIPSTVVGGEGYFCGYGATEYVILADRDTVYYY